MIKEKKKKKRGFERFQSQGILPSWRRIHNLQISNEFANVNAKLASYCGWWPEHVPTSCTPFHAWGHMSQSPSQSFGGSRTNKRLFEGNMGSRFEVWRRKRKGCGHTSLVRCIVCTRRRRVTWLLHSHGKRLCIAVALGASSLNHLIHSRSELNEIIEAMNAGESVATILYELFDDVKKIAWSDSQSALSILSSEGGSWRTRHLRMRASYARQAVLSGDWAVGHVPGEELNADLGTKALSSNRIDKLKGLLGMAQRPGESKRRKRNEEGSWRRSKREGIKCVQSISSRHRSQADHFGCHDFCWEIRRRWGGRTWSERTQSDDGYLRHRHCPVDLVGSDCVEGRSRKASPGHQRSIWRSRPKSPCTRRSNRGSTKSSRSSPWHRGWAGVERLIWALGPPPSFGPGGRGKHHPTGWDGAWIKEIQSASLSPMERHQAPRVGRARLLEAWKLGIEEELIRIIQEEAEMWREIRQTPLPPVIIEEVEENDAEGLRSNVLRTTYGVVYHSDRSCRHLQGPRVGQPRPFKWCQVCRRVALQTRGSPPPGTSLYLSVTGTAAHSDERCPWIREGKLTPFCQTCREREGVVCATGLKNPYEFSMGECWCHPLFFMTCHKHDALTCQLSICTNLHIHSCSCP